MFDRCLDPVLIALFVGLGARAVHRRALPHIQHAELDASRINGLPHQTAERIDLADEVTFGHTADGRIAAHLTDRVQVGRDQRGFCAQPSRCGCRFGASVTSSDNDDVVRILDRSHGPFQKKIERSYSTMRRPDGERLICANQASWFTGAITGLEKGDA